MAQSPDPSSRLQVTFTHDGFTCDVPGSGAIGPLVLLVGGPGLAVLLMAAIASPWLWLLAIWGAVMSLVVSVAWADASLRPSRLVVHRDRLQWKAPAERDVEIGLAGVRSVRPRIWGLRVQSDGGVIRLFSPTDRGDLAWIAAYIEQAAQRTRASNAEFDTDEVRARQRAVEALRQPSSDA